MKLFENILILISVLACIILAAFAISARAEERPCCPKTKTVYVTKKEYVHVPSNTNTSVTAPASSKSDATAGAAAQTGNQSQTVTVMAPPPVIIKKTKVKIVKRKVRIYKPNRLLLLGGFSKSRLVECADNYICRKYRPDFGLQYIRDFGRVSGSIMGTADKAIYLGIGVNW